MTKCEKASNFWQELKLTSKLQSDLRDSRLELEVGCWFQCPMVSIRSVKFISPEVALYVYKFTIRPCMEYCCHVWAGAVLADAWIC